MSVRVLFLGPACDWAGMSEASFEHGEGATVATLAERIYADLPALAERRAVLRFAVNQNFAGDDVEIHDGDEVAIIPPVSGGVADADDLVAIVDTPIDAAAVRHHVDGDGGTGAVAVFEGITRFERHVEHGGLLRLEYESYGEMALSEMRALAEKARHRWPILKLAIVHRVGAVGIGEASVMIVVASGHRAEAFDACRWLIDTLKQQVPIWKREIWASGESSWVDPTASGEGS